MARKGSLNLSVQAIVIVVLAMTLLGLGLGFVRNIFADMGKLSSETFTKIADELGQRLATGDEKLIFSSVELTIERSDSTLEGIGVKNEEDATIKYGVHFSPVSCPAAQTSDGKCTDAEIASWFTYVTGAEAYSLDAGDNHVKRVDIKVPSSTKTGLYLLKVLVYTGTAPTAAGCDGTSCFPFDSTEVFLTVT